MSLLNRPRTPARLLCVSVICFALVVLTIAGTSVVRLDHRQRVEAATAARLESQGCGVGWSTRRASPPERLANEILALLRLARKPDLDPEEVEYVASIDLIEMASPVRALHECAVFREILELNASGMSLGEAELREICQFQNLISLMMGGCQVSPDVDTACLGSLQHLKELYIPETDLTNQQFDFLTELPELELLMLEDTDAGDYVAPILASLPRLSELDLRRTRVTDAGVRELAQIANLERLYLTGCTITDASIAELAKVPRLRVLELRDTWITDVGLQYLAEVPTLENLSLKDTLVTPEGVARFQHRRAEWAMKGSMPSALVFILH